MTGVTALRAGDVYPCLAFQRFGFRGGVQTMRDTLIIAAMALGVLVMAKTMPAQAHAAPMPAPAIEQMHTPSN